MRNAEAERADHPSLAVGRRPGDDFVFVARRLGADEDKGRFEAKLGKIAKAKPKAAKR